MRFLVASLLLFLGSAQPVLADSTFDNTEIKNGICVMADEMILPSEPTSREETMVILRGHLPNACWGNVSTDVTYSESAGRYDIVVLAERVADGEVCASKPADYKVTANLGYLRAGTHALWAWGIETREVIVIP